MPYYHIWIKTKQGKDYFEYDHTEESVEKCSKRYRQRESLFFSGRVTSSNDVRTFRVCMTDSPKKEYGGMNIWDEGSDVTRDFMQKPVTPKPAVANKKPITLKPTNANIFIVHGRDHTPMKELKTMLYEFGLKPIVLHEQPSGSRTIVEKLEKYSDVGYAFVILTPDDVTLNKFDDVLRKLRTKEEFEMRVSKRAFESMIERRARQNVVLEFGYFMGLLGRNKVCCLHKGDIELPSDMHGIVYIPFEETVKEVEVKIIKELTEAGYEIKL